MKIEFKQSFEIEGKEFKIKNKDKAEIVDVPSHFEKIDFFKKLIAEGKIKILEEVSKDEKPNSIPDINSSISHVEVEVKIEDEENEFNILKDKEKRLSKNEKKRFEELKAKLNKEL